MKYLKRILYDKSCEDEPHFCGIIEELRKLGIECSIIVPKETAVSVTDGLLMICACEISVNLARISDAAFVCYKTDAGEAQCIIEGFYEVDEDFLEKMYQRKYGIPWEIAETKRLILREFTTEDHRDIFPELSLDPEFTEKYIQNMYGFFGYGIWAVVLKETGDIIGRAGIYDSTRTNGFEIGYAIDAPYRRRGYAYEACQAVITFSENRLGQKELFALIEPHNCASIALAEKLGFRPVPGFVSTDGKSDRKLQVFYRGER